jgi:hypothetical protein
MYASESTYCLRFYVATRQDVEEVTGVCTTEWVSILYPG